MSRTIRRTSTSGNHKRFEDDYTKSESGERLEGKDFDVAYHKFHSDNGLPIFFYENSYEYPIRESSKTHRAQNKTEIMKWLKNQDHEVVFHKVRFFCDYY
jgi:hypothetical protein